MALKRGRAPKDPAQTSPYSAMHTGLGRALTAVYGIFALAATARAGYEFVAKLELAPFPYSLSLLAAIVYIVATVCFVIGNRTSHRIAIIACAIELIGVVIVGALSMAAPDLFLKTDGSGETVTAVWSGFGVGYGCIPLLLPVLGLWWLFGIGKRVAAQEDGAQDTGAEAA